MGKSVTTSRSTGDLNVRITTRADKPASADTSGVEPWPKTGIAEAMMHGAPVSDHCEVDALRQRVAYVEAERDAARAAINDVCAEVDRMGKALVEAGSDTRRLDWLADDTARWNRVWTAWSGEGPFRETLRAAIDAAEGGGK